MCAIFSSSHSINHTKDEHFMCNKMHTSRRRSEDSNSHKTIYLSFLQIPSHCCISSESDTICLDKQIIQPRFIAFCPLRENISRFIFVHFRSKAGRHRHRYRLRNILKPFMFSCWIGGEWERSTNHIATDSLFEQNGEKKLVWMVLLRLCFMRLAVNYRVCN